MQFTVLKLSHAVTQVERVSFAASRLKALKQNSVIDFLSQPVFTHIFKCFAE